MSIPGIILGACWADYITLRQSIVYETQTKSSHQTIYGAGCAVVLYHRSGLFLPYLHFNNLIFPEMRKCSKSGIYERMQKFADITVWLVLNNKTQRASKCLAAAERLFINGSIQMRNAITVVYIYHLAAILEFHHYDLKGMLPQSLYREYVRISSFGL